MPKLPRREEVAAFKLVERALGVEVAFNDTGGDSRVDGLFVHPNGSPAAIEVTRLGDPTTLETEALLHRREWSVPGVRWAWHAWVPPSVRVTELDVHFPVAIRACEAAGVTDPVLLANVDESAAWIVDQEIRLHGFPETAHPGTISAIVEGGGGGAVDDELGLLCPWLEEQLESDLLRSHVAKLEATARPEQHLFLIAHDSSMPESLVVSASFGDSVPIDAPRIPDNVTALWLAIRWRDTVLVWTRGSGWSNMPHEE